MPEDLFFVSIHRFARMRRAGRTRLHRRELRELARIRNPERFNPQGGKRRPCTERST